MARRDRILALWVFLAAVALHVAPWIQYRSDPFSLTLISDALSYDEWARQIGSAGFVSQPVFHQAPLYPVLLSWIYAAAPAGARLNAVIALQILLTAAALASLVFLAKRFLDSSRAGVAGAGLALLHGPFVFHALKILPVAVALASQAALLVALAAARRRPTAWMAFASGASLGIAALARAEVLLFAPVALVAVAGARPRGGGRAAAAAAFVVGALIGVAPATIHNLNRGDAVLIASSGGENLYIGNKRGAAGDYTPLHPKAGDLFSERILAQQLADAESGRRLSASEVSAFWTRKAVHEIAADPSGWLRLEMKKLGRILHPGDPNDSYSFPLERSLYLSSLWLLPLPAWSLLGMGIWGAALALRRTPRLAWPLLTFVLFQAATLLLFFVNTRLRLPFLFFLAPFAGLALLELFRFLRQGRSGAFASGACLFLAFAISGWVWTRPSPRDAVRLAAVLSMQGRLDEGLAVLAPFLDTQPPYALAFDQAGWLLQKQGRFIDAARRYRDALSAGLSPARAVQTRTRLALSLEKSGDPGGALAEHDRAVADPDANAGTLHERGLFRVRHGDLNGGADDLRRAAQLDPTWNEPKEALRRLTSGSAPLDSTADPPQ